MKSLITMLLFIIAAANLSCTTKKNRSESKDVEDIATMRAVPDTQDEFVVYCKYHQFDDTPEYRTAEEIRNNQVCLGGEGGVNSGCDYTGSDGSGGIFTVISEDKMYSERVDGYNNAQLYCRMGIAVLYDGDDLYAFDFINKKFVKSNGVEDNGKILLSGSRQMVMVYDQDDIFIYDPGESPNSWGRYNGVEDNAIYFEYLLRKRALLLYDGDDLHSYCKGKWNRENSVEDNDSSVTVKSTGNLLFSGGYSVNIETCVTN